MTAVEVRPYRAREPDEIEGWERVVKNAQPAVPGRLEPLAAVVEFHALPPSMA